MIYTIHGFSADDSTRLGLGTAADRRVALLSGCLEAKCLPVKTLASASVLH